MSAKIILSFCAHLVLAHVSYSQCINYGRDLYPRPIPASIESCVAFGGRGIAFGNEFNVGPGLSIGAGLGNSYAGTGSSGIEIIPTSGGSLPVSSASPTAPVGISVVSENVIEGLLNVVGELPFVGTVAFENMLPSVGAGVVHYDCGNGNTAITAEATDFAGFGSAGAVVDAIGYGASVPVTPFRATGLGLTGGRRCGCGN